MFQWRTTTPARNRPSPPGFIRPCQPVLAREVPTGPNWIHELKWDGYRILARRTGGVTRSPKPGGRVLGCRLVTVRRMHPALHTKRSRGQVGNRGHFEEFLERAGAF